MSQLPPEQLRALREAGEAIDRWYDEHKTGVRPVEPFPRSPQEYLHQVIYEITSAELCERDPAFNSIVYDPPSPPKWTWDVAYERARNGLRHFYIMAPDLLTALPERDDPKRGLREIRDLFTVIVYAGEARPNTTRTAEGHPGTPADTDATRDERDSLTETHKYILDAMLKLGATDDERDSLTETHKYILDAMLKLGATDKERRKPRTAISEKAGIASQSGTAKLAFRELKRRGLIATEDGRQGGTWLTVKGETVAR